MIDKIHPDTLIGDIRLNVSDLDRSLEFYEGAVGLQCLDRKADRAYLGAGEKPVVVLHQVPGARRAPGRTGLYHFAILVPTREDLGRAIQRVRTFGALIDGGADHLVSEAIYLTDPDGTGIEIYRDRPREAWPRQDGQIQMATEPLDLEDVVLEGRGAVVYTTTLPPKATLGHVHLHVADLGKAERFYCEVLGFELVTRFGSSAAFVAAGGYHHHVGLNTWAGVGAPPPPPDAAGLRSYTISLPDSAALSVMVERVRSAGVPLEEGEDGLLVRDPCRNAIRLAARNPQ